MVNSLIENYDQSLANLFQGSGYSRLAQGTYVRSDDNVIWRGLRVQFDLTTTRVLAQPYLAVFCPTASQLVEEGLRRAYGRAARDRNKKLGQPLIIHPLYDRIRSLFGDSREPFSYHVEVLDQIGEASELIYEDFLKVADRVFGQILSMRGLRDKIVTQPTDTSAGINAMALSYLLDAGMNYKDVDRLVLISPNPMTKKFAMYMKSKIDAGGTDETRSG